MNNITPERFTVKIEISADDYLKLRDQIKRVYDFYIYSKKIENGNVFLEIRAFRINEFLDILNVHKITFVNHG